jgi:hypothetical protein
VTITGLSPAVIIYGAATDGWSDAEEFFDNYEPDHRARFPLPQVPMVPIPSTHRAPFDPINWTMAVFALPITVTYNAIKHTYYCARHAVDLFYTPVYVLASFHSGSSVEPLDLYTGTIFDRAPSTTASGDNR